MIAIKAPEKMPLEARTLPSIFLAGSIEMGAAEEWQVKATKYFEKDKVLVMNPRRDSWDSSWKQTIHNPKFKEQVTWELDMIDHASVVFIYLDPNTKSPISLLELGLVAERDTAVVCCPDGFWRKGNIEIVCERENIPLFDDFDYALAFARKKLLSL
jgi:hypothetical protein